MIDQMNRNMQRAAGISNLGRKAFGVGLAIVMLIMGSKLMFSVNVHEVVALTYPNGKVEFFTSPGMNGQWLGHIQSFEKRTPYAFEEPIQFIDGAHAKIHGSVQYEVPLDSAHLRLMYERYPTPEGIQKGLIETNIQKAVYLTGQMMTSKESYAEKRSDLLRYIEDQTENGVYQTKQKQIEVPDQFDDKKKKAMIIVEVALDQKTGQVLRQESGVLKQFGLATGNFTMRIEYDPEVEKQIQAQQKLAQDINLSIADAKKAEQRAITVAKNGEANAAQAKWEQETLNARVVAESEGRVLIATQDKLAAELNKQKLILEGEGEAEKKKLVMSADGALTQKLEAWVQVQKSYANAVEHYAGNWVPTVVTGGGGGTSQNAATTLLETLGIKAAKDLALDLSVPNRSQK